MRLKEPYRLVECARVAGQNVGPIGITGLVCLANVIADVVAILA